MSLGSTPDYSGPPSQVYHVVCEHSMNTASKFLHYFLSVFQLKFLALTTVMTLLYVQFLVAIHDLWSPFVYMVRRPFALRWPWGELLYSFREPVAWHFSLRIKLEDSQKLVSAEATHLENVSNQRIRLIRPIKNSTFGVCNGMLDRKKAFPGIDIFLNF
ncbi:hypothetical protein B0J12DRAFT_12118 [Macrophomina phaseolina]|uniref:Uncharacterized protein n=1 Tax=Macrophomina phaseolina TaxID=35725 RepID=A0ABQ8GUX1_9PEZI|nr:hypothetical protein B0J12DRAFT_12118 [Macrophomina phaseolina]